MKTDLRAAKLKKKQQRWQERQERSRLNRAEIYELRKRLQELRATLDAAEGDTTTPVTIRAATNKNNNSTGSSSNNKNNDDGNAVSLRGEAHQGVSNLYTHFSQLPLSQRTQLGLERGNYKRMTPIQSDALHLALAGYDVLGAAKTGSGKTLCFVVPVLERLFVEQWDAAMGVGALVLSPTRELALQIFKVLQLVGYKHVLSAALLTGGRDVCEERKRLAAISIIVGTPGRVLHHLEDDAGIVTDNMQLFVMDEADRLLDMGFRDAICGILRHLPAERQTLLFSATQTTDVNMLAQMSLRNQRYVTSHAATAAPTPGTLCQNFILVELHRKLDVLLMFLKRHPNDKIVVFVSTCNQVRFMYLTFSKILKKMRIPSMCLTSKMKQFRREEVFLTFCRCKSAVLFCTDIAARGLDFPLVHWALQYDCPDSAQTYIHRAGRTARAGARGVSLLFLTPRETPMLSFLAHKHIPLREIAIRPGLLQESKEIFVALVVQGLKYEAQKAFIAYLRSVSFASNKLVFDAKSIDVEKFAHSLGLLKVPNMTELHNMRRGAKNLPWDVVNYISNNTAKQEKQQPCTRRERHLAAADMFRTLQQKQRYATRDDNYKDKPQDNGCDGEPGFYGGKTNKTTSSNNSNNNNGNKNVYDSNDDYEDDGFLIRCPRTNSTADVGGGDNSGRQDEAATMRLSVAERIAGLSKRKVRKYIQAADLRVRDLGLSEHIVFADDDDDDDDDVEKKDENSGGHQKHKKNIPMAPVYKKKEENGDDDDADENNIDEYTEVLRQRVLREAESDAERAKTLRRLRRMQREGKIGRRTSLQNSSVSAATGGKRHASAADDDDNSVENFDDSASSTGSLSRLIKAAKGELYSDDDDSAEEDNMEENTASGEDIYFESKNSGFKLKKKKTRYA